MVGLNKLILVLFLLIFINSILSVDRNRFKKCDQIGFCKRNRDYASQTDKLSPYTLISNSIDRSVSGYRADVINKENNHLFNLQISNYDEEGKIVRVTLSEKNPIRTRFDSSDDVILDGVQHIDKIDNNQLIFGNTKVNTNPLSFEFYNKGESSPFLTANGKGLLQFEHYRNKDDNNEQKNNDTDNNKNDDDAHLIYDNNNDNSVYKKMNDEDAWEENFSGHNDKKPFGPSSVGLDFTFNGAKHVYGIPEHASSFSLKTTVGETDPYRLYNLDVFEYELDETMALYGSVPLMIGHHKGQTSAVFWLNPSETWIDIEHEEEGTHSHWFSESGNIDFFILFGESPKDIMRQYASLTGFSMLPPYFSIAYHQCRWNYMDMDDVKFVDSQFDEFDLPYDVIWLDIEHTDGKKYFTWDPKKFSEPEKMINNIASKGRKMVTIVDPHIKRDSGYYIHKNAEENELYVKKENGKDDYDGWCWPGSSMYLDFSAEHVRDWWSEQFDYSNYIGSTPDLFIWNDMNEPSVFNGPEVTMSKDLVHKEGGNWEHREIHNLFGKWVHQSTAKGLSIRDEVNRRPFVLSRAFFSGSQQYGAIWTGDNAAEWGHLQAAQPMLLSLSVAGISFCGADVGGFFGDPETELLERWYQAGAYQPFFRGHGHLDTKRREPYLFDEPTPTIIRKALRSRYRLLPYWYTLFYESTKTGVPPMRPLFFEYPEDEYTYNMENQFLVGSSLLVKPIVEKNRNSVHVYLPGNQPWYNYNTLTKIEQSSPQNIITEAPREYIPVFLRGGSILPRKDRPRRSSTQMASDPFTIVIALDNDFSAEGSLYIDDGFSFDYQQNKYSYQSFTYKSRTFSSRNIANGYDCSLIGVERIVIIGLLQNPQSIKLQQENEPPILLNFFKYDNNITIIKKPPVSICSDYDILL
eukprot:TRINITY_DN12075_c0_g1_i1.p1 TRINITY_DN12075_c0_g1~~TRINITY_DN12075_c0_g1_i1.p1  ORF type:complete len:916 (+),score=328.64 TRINITY_DN12075_c0_g1_i1:28-2775(+)